MTYLHPRRLRIASGIIAFLYVACHYFGATAQEETPNQKPKKKRPAALKIEANDRVSVDVARDRARTMHKVFATTLETMHRHYFHGDKAAVPARAMEDSFYSIRYELKIDARWIAVNARAMSIDHEAETDFEKDAVRVLSSGKSAYERVEDGYYRRAETIPLHGGCIRCHSNAFGEPPKVAKFAGLVLSVPIHLDDAPIEAVKPTTDN
ncbi:MAG: DUF3365 domain-containing protein [Planctomycetota bacterium]|nr:DUF3365 domain-containing protein [Planctomycetota bacterium]MDA1212299.1 DUF3365 domain-containing protein [Planctomycetota bacterium]